MSDSADIRRLRQLLFGTSGAFLVTFAVVVAVAMLTFSSNPTGMAGFTWLAFPLIGIVSLGAWLAVAVHAVVQRRLPVGLLVAPVIGLVTVALLYFSIPSKARFVVLDRPAFDAIVAGVSAPVIDLPDHDLTEDESYDQFDDFPGRCPAWIGTIRVYECATFGAGYLFYDVAGSGLVDDGGVAYLPQGVPRYDVGNGSFESPEFFHLTGPWYAFASSW